MEELSPETKSLYEMLKAETTEEYASMFMAHKKEILDVVRVKASSTTSSTAPLPVPRDTAPIANPTITAASPAVLKAKHDSPKDDLSPEAGRIYDYLVGGSAPPVSAMTDVSTNLLVRTEIDAVHDAVDIDNTGLTAPASTNCSSECPSRGASDLEVALSSSATTTSSSLLSLRCRNIWKERNCRVFREKPSALRWLLNQTQEDAKTWALAGAKKLRRLICEPP